MCKLKNIVCLFTLVAGLYTGQVLGAEHAENIEKPSSPYKILAGIKLFGSSLIFGSIGGLLSSALNGNTIGKYDTIWVPLTIIGGWNALSTTYDISDKDMSPGLKNRIKDNDAYIKKSVYLFAATMVTQLVGAYIGPRVIKKMASVIT